MIFAHDELNGRECWLIGGQGQNVIRIWEDGGVEDLGISQKVPAYFGKLLFSQTGNSLAVRQLLEIGSKTIKEINGDFTISSFHTFLDVDQITEIYAKRGKQIVRIDLHTLEISEIGPDRGYLRFVAPGDFYYVESKSWPYGKPDKWRKVYLLKDGKMLFLKQFDFREPGRGSVWVEEHGIVFYDMDTPRFFAFPNLLELRFKGLN